MVYRALSDTVVVGHLLFLVFIPVGGFLAWRWRWIIGVHVAAVVWGAASIVIGFDCPLTPLENGLRKRGGEATYEGGFVNRYVEDVLYPDEYTPYLRALAILLVVTAYARLLRVRRASRPAVELPTSVG